MISLLPVLRIARGEALERKGIADDLAQSPVGLDVSEGNGLD